MATMERVTPPPQSARAKKVAAYARISMENDRTPKSLSAQISRYSDLIQSTPGWEYAGVYADSGISGTTTNRPQFQAMLAQARAGGIDLILTKSISRFARNTVDLLETIRELKTLGVEVRFEKENISTFSADGELVLTLLASFAQAESEQISQNVKWRVRKGFEQGKANGFHLYGYTDSPDATDVEIVEAEAEVVRWMFAHYMLPTSCEAMAAQLITDGRVPHLADNQLPGEWVRHILKNPSYTGDLLLGQWATPDGKPGRALRNTGEHPMYLVEGAIPAIIDRDTFTAVQAEIARRRDLGARANWSIETVAMTSKIKCATCGCSFVRNRRNPKTQNQITTEHWICTERKKGRTTSCRTIEISDTALKTFIADVLGIDEFDDDVFTARIDHIDVTGKDHYTFHYTDDTTSSHTWRPNLKKSSWTPAKKAAWAELVKARWDNARKLGIDGRSAPAPPEALAKYRAVAKAEAERLRAKRGER
ncbi:recombinase family protein [Corynebacterium vitaeruminis]|uniref:Phage integrase family site-specific recombinase n=1 Tax=Corynebacterium vitaeruminis DSM 20294 TaxID=1224164 RepID=W5XYQ2_9CORY|nr:recombinase family protein [Corynebacterium vitaeruminis]AHI22072.1 phage integrase family site-specific recombinase [Corynebacterium vitaeruminis DSM 20294]